MILIITPVDNENILIGIRKVKAKRNFVKKVVRVAVQIDFLEFFLLDSCERCIHKASEKESATAIVKIPHITTIRDHVHEVKPTISHNVVIIHEVIPKVIHVFIDCFMVLMEQ